MYKLGEHPVVAKFPQSISQFSITFYGTDNKGNACITLYRDDGVVLAKQIIKKVGNNRYGFRSPIEDIAGFSLESDLEIGGFAIYEIRYKKPAFTGFLDTFQEITTLDLRTSDSGHLWAYIQPFDFSGTPNLFLSDFTVNNGFLYPTIYNSGTSYICAKWYPQTKSWYYEVTFIKEITLGTDTVFRIGMKQSDGMYLGPELTIYANGDAYLESLNNFPGVYEEYLNAFPDSATEYKVRFEMIDQTYLKYYLNDELIYDSNDFGPISWMTGIYLPTLEVRKLYPEEIKITRVEANDLNPIAIVPTTLVAVSNRSIDFYSSGSMNIMTSRTGDVWVPNWDWYENENVAEGYTFNGIEYGNGIFLAVADSPHYFWDDPVNRQYYGLKSSDGNTWTPCIEDGVTGVYFNDIRFCNDIFIVTNNLDEYDYYTGDDGNRIAKSSNGDTWTTQVISGGPWYSAAYGNSTYVLVGNGTEGSRVAYSSNATDWTLTNSLASADGSWHRVAWCNNIFIALGLNQGGTNKQMMTSSDGISWSSIDLPVEAEVVQWQDVIYANGIYVAVGRDLYDNYSNSAFKSAIMTSTNGTDWTIRTTPCYGSWRSVVYANSKFFAVADGSDGVWSAGWEEATAYNLISSTNGIDWVTERPSVMSCWVSIATNSA